MKPKTLFRPATVPGGRWLFPALVALLSTLGILVCQAGPKVKAPVNPEHQELKDEGFRQLFSSVFTRWDRDQDGQLDLKELNTAIEDPQLHGNEAAIVAVLRRHIPSEESNEPRILTRAQALALAGDPQVQQAVLRNAWHIQAINHSLFLPEDPNLETFHQGGMGDCYLLSVIGDFVYQNPQAVRMMIRPQSDGSFAVQFGNGKHADVEPLSDAELIMGATEGRDHGIWLSVLEKAFGRLQVQAKEARTGEVVEADDASFADFIGHGGYYGPVIALLSGHKTAGAPIGRWFKEDPETALGKLHDLLTTEAAGHRLMATGTRGDKTLPKGIAHGHVFAVLDYNPASRLVRMFNPWGNHVKPAGPPGLIHGYTTQHGVFEVPLADFPEIFAGLIYETDKPVKR
jgi:hypothetical protein